MNNKIILSLLFLAFHNLTSKAQDQTNSSLQIGGYGQVDYTQAFAPGDKQNANLDVHRLVMLMTYKYNPKLELISEIEFEHVSELFVEQAYLNYKIKPGLNFRAGLLLIPMGIINEKHEPNTFNGVHRPFIDNVLAPTTWREIGAGIHGNFTNIGLKYQANLVNGFMSYNGTALLNGTGFRKARQKGAKAIMSYPNIAARVEYYSIKNLQLGLSYYGGKTSSSLYKSVDLDNETDVLKADSSIVGLQMLGFDAVYNKKALSIKTQVYYSSINNSVEYNNFTKSGTKLNDLGSAMFGFYAEASYNIFKHFKEKKSELIPFVRYENYDTHFEVEGITKNKVYHTQAIVTGISWKPNQNTAFKIDYQFTKTDIDTKYFQQLNAGIGFMF